jgi:uncharacterized protein with GYD domain
MPTYIGLYKLTEQGIRNIKDAPKRLEENVKNAEAAGSKVISFYAVMGEYDYVVISESPSDEVVMTNAMKIRSKGNVTITTLKAFTQQEFMEMVRKLP